MPVASVGDRIKEHVLGWEGVSAGSHRFGGTEFRLGGREIGHIHGDQIVDVPFPRRIRDELVLAGKAQPHHILPSSGWVSLFIREEADVERAIALLRQSYDLAVRQQMSRPPQIDDPGRHSL